MAIVVEIREGGAVVSKVIDLCADPLCMGEATHHMISRVPGRRTMLCAEHHRRILAAAEKAGFGPDKVALLDIRPLDGEARS